MIVEKKVVQWKLRVVVLVVVDCAVAKFVQFYSGRGVIFCSTCCLKSTNI